MLLGDGFCGGIAVPVSCILSSLSCLCTKMNMGQKGPRSANQKRPEGAQQSVGSKLLEGLANSGQAFRPKEILGIFEAISL